jgi:hypothetical protein
MIIYKNNEKYIHFDYEYEEYTGLFNAKPFLA